MSSCRATRQRIDWNDEGVVDGDSAAAHSYICQAHVMPQAGVTFDNFRLSTAPNQPALIASSGLSQWTGTGCP